MIKNIIFDLDNTIIKYKDEYALNYKQALKNCGYDEDDYLNIYDVLDYYEHSLTDSNSFYSRKTMINFLNQKLNTNYDIKLIDELNAVIGKYWTHSILLPEDTLKYLSSKYNIYVFTNWFESPQADRLKNIGYLKYFKKIFGADTIGAKPFKSSFNNLLNYIEASSSECIMIGDNKKMDILGANNAGIPAILFDFDGKRDKPDILAPNYKVITDLKALDKIL